MMALGILHFIFPETATPKVPLWIPGKVVANYLSGAVLIAAGCGIFFPKTARTSSVFLGITIFLSMIFIHAPVVLASSRFESDWCKTLVMSGGAFLLARTLNAPNRQITDGTEHQFQRAT
jgi:uncharacterized membrane protein